MDREQDDSEVTMEFVQMSEPESLTATDTVQGYKDGTMTDVDATVINECHFAIFLNDTYYANMSKKQAFMEAMSGHCLILTDIIPQYLQEFSIGYSVCNGQVSPEKISSVNIVEADEENYVSCVFVDELTMQARRYKVEDHHLAYNTNTGRNIAVSPTKIIEEMKAFISRPELIKTTGTTYAAEIFDGSSAIKTIEDINEVNTLYKIIGYAMTYGIDLSGSVLFTTGRIFKESVHACEVAGCHMLVSKAPPTRQAIEYAMEKDITLISFDSEDSFKVYNGVERIMY